MSVRRFDRLISGTAGAKHERSDIHREKEDNDPLGLVHFLFEQRDLTYRTEQDDIANTPFRRPLGRYSSSHYRRSESVVSEASAMPFFLRQSNSEINLALRNLSSKIDSTKDVIIDVITEKTRRELGYLYKGLSKKIENQTATMMNKLKGTDKEKIETGQEDMRFDVNMDAGAVAASKKRRNHSTNQTCNDKATEWKLDAKTWQMCIASNDKKEAKRLICDRILPDDEMLNSVSTAFGSDPQILDMICGEISSYIKAQSKTIINVYAGFEHKDDKLVEEKNLVFAVITTSHIAVENICGYKIEQICIHEVNSSQENKEIKLKEREYPINEDNLIKAERVMNRHSEALMKRHQNISRISVSWVKSIKFGTADASLRNEVCVTLYVPRKGLIPIGEKPFPKILNGFAVDVREGVCVPFQGSHDVHANIKIGCAISGHTTSDTNFSGTLGGFFENENQVYGLTCAHVFLRNPNLTELDSKGTWKASDSNDPLNNVYQPNQVTEPFGSLIRAVFTRGDGRTSGVDAAIIHVKSRHPNSGLFPDEENDDTAGFDVQHPMMFHSGKLSQKVNRMDLVVKHGSSTGKTKGSFRVRGGAIRTNTSHNWGYVFYKQYEIESFGNTTFATEGDSGAMVFTVEGDDELTGIGIVGAGMGDICFATPIYDVFSALCIPPPFEMKRFVPQDYTGADCSGETVVSTQDEAKRLENTEAMTVKLDNLDQTLSQEFAKQMKEFSINIDKKLSDFKSEIDTKNENTAIQLCADFDQKITRLEEKMKDMQTENRDQMQKIVEDTLEKKMDQLINKLLCKK